MPRMLDLFCGRWGWSRAFAARGWQCVGVDLKRPNDIPEGCEFVQMNVLNITPRTVETFDFCCASSPCEEFSVHGMKLFHPNPKFPETGVNLFNYTRSMCQQAEILYVIENVRAAQQFVGQAVNHCGPFYLWGSGVPVLFNQGITKGSLLWSKRYRNMCKKQRKMEVATIPPELANCVADYAEYFLSAKVGK